MGAVSRTAIVGIAVAFTAGGVVALQVRANGALGQALHSGTLAATVSFVVGVAGSALAVAFNPRARRGLASVPRLLRERRIRWWNLLGGLSGALFIFAQSATGALLGAALFSVGIIAGQMLSSLLVDRAGIGPSGRIPVTLRRTVAALLGLIAGVTAMIGAPDVAHTVWLMIFPFAAGIALAWQQAVNARVAVASDDPLGVVFLNFVLGLAILLPAGIVVLVRGDWIGSWSPDPLLYSGGLLGIVIFVLANVVVPRIGVLVFALATVTGQLVFSIALDVLFPTRAHVTTSILVGVAVALVAVALGVMPAKGDGPAKTKAR